MARDTTKRNGNNGTIKGNSLWQSASIFGLGTSSKMSEWAFTDLPI